MIGLWSFGGPLPEPAWIGGYGDLPRRLIRLAHIALFALGMINLMLVRQHAGFDLSARTTRLALAAMNLGNLLMPTLLFAAVFLPAAKYLLALPALAVSTALAIAAYGGWRHWWLRRSSIDPRRKAAKAARDPARIGRYDDFEEDLGLDSLHRLDVLAEVEDELGLRISEDQLSEVRDLASLLAAVGTGRCEKAA